MSELRRCPFCGGEAHTIEPARYGKSWGVRCECGAFLGFEYTEAEAIAAWNARAERTCELEMNIDLTAIQCDRCGYKLPKGTELEKVRFCAGCGAKVIGG